MAEPNRIERDSFAKGSTQHVGDPAGAAVHHLQQRSQERIPPNHFNTDLGLRICRLVHLAERATIDRQVLAVVEQRVILAFLSNQVPCELGDLVWIGSRNVRVIPEFAVVVPGENRSR